MSIYAEWTRKDQALNERAELDARASFERYPHQFGINPTLQDMDELSDWLDEHVGQKGNDWEWYQWDPLIFVIYILENDMAVLFKLKFAQAK